MRQIAIIVDDWRIGEVTDAGALLRITREIDDQAPPEHREPLDPTTTRSTT